MTLTADIGIVGAGPAGLALAHELQTRGKRVLLLESGGPTPTPEAQELNAGETAGDQYPDLRFSRCRAVGGTAATWNTMFRNSRFAKYVPLDSIDFESRDGMEWSGWPFGRETLSAYYAQAQSFCGAGPWDYSGTAWSDERHPLLSLGASLTSSVHQHGRADRFTVTLPAALAAASAVTLVHGASVTQLSLSSGRAAVGEVRWATLRGTGGSARAACWVLAAGAIENARLLLSSLPEKGHEVDRGDWLGRGFMEHPIDSSLRLSSRSQALALVPGFYRAHDTPQGTPVVGRIGIAAELLRAEQLRNASVRLFDEEPSFRARRFVPGWVRRFRAGRYRVYIDLEQAPHRDNRIVLSGRPDRFGRPLSALHWRWREQDERGRQRLRVLVARELADAGVGRIRVDPHSPLEPNVHHHAGTTRMHRDPLQGVVDEQLRVHGLENLFVAGASVFPTAGHANPTLTCVALSLRLADHLAGALTPPQNR